MALDIEPLPAVISAREAAKPGAPQLWDDVPGNIALDYHYGDKDKVAEAFAKAAHVVRLPLINQRLVVNAIEPRSAIGEFDAKDEKWTLHSCSQGVFGLKNMMRGHPWRAGRQGARAHRQCRRLVRDESGVLSGICLHPARRPRAGPAGEVDRRALRQLRVRPSWPRLRHDRRSGLRQRRFDPGDPAFRLRQSGRLLRGLRSAAADRQCDEEHRQHVPHAAARGRDPMRVHQHDAGVGLSRRRAAGRRLQHGAHDGFCRRPARHRPVRTAAAQFHQGARDAVQGGFGRDLRLRRFSRPVQGRARARRRQRLQAAQAREQARRQTARARASPAMSKPPRR